MGKWENGEKWNNGGKNMTVGNRVFFCVGVICHWLVVYYCDIV